MKKTIILLFVLFTAVSIFAAENTVFLTGSPYAVQLVSTTIDTNHKQNYGFGFKAGYRHSYSTFEFGGDLAYHNYKYEKAHITAHLGNLQVLAKAGLKFDFSEKAQLRVGIGPGLSFSFSRSGKNINFLAGADLEFNYAVSKLFYLTAGFDASFEITKTKNSVYGSNVWNLVPSIGAGIRF